MNVSMFGVCVCGGGGEHQRQAIAGAPVAQRHPAERVLGWPMQGGAWSPECFHATSCWQPYRHVARRLQADTNLTSGHPPGTHCTGRGCSPYPGEHPMHMATLDSTVCLGCGGRQHPRLHKISHDALRIAFRDHAVLCVPHPGAPAPIASTLLPATASSSNAS